MEEIFPYQLLSVLLSPEVKLILKNTKNVLMLLCVMHFSFQIWIQQLWFGRSPAEVEGQRRRTAAAE